MEIGWIYYGFSGAIANFVVWISLFFPVKVTINYNHNEFESKTTGSKSTKQQKRLLD